MANCALLNLPSELKRRTASFLSPYDALRLSETCKSLNISLSLRLLRNSRVLFARPQLFSGGVEDGDRQLPFVRIPCIFRRVHSLTITFRWRDQARGHRKGKLWVIGRPRAAPLDKSKPFHGGRVVCKSPLAPHDTEDYKMTFLPFSMEGEVYQLWYRVGGGGGHQLHLFDGKLDTVIFDDEHGNLSRNYQILQTVGAVGVHPETSDPSERSSFYPQLLMLASRSIRSALKNHRGNNETATANNDGQVVAAAMDDQLTAFFRTFHIPINEGSLLAVEEIIQSDLDHQAFAQSQGDQERNTGEAGVLRVFATDVVLGIENAVHHAFHQVDLRPDLLDFDAGVVIPDFLDNDAPPLPAGVIDNGRGRADDGAELPLLDHIVDDASDGDELVPNDTISDDDAF
jgi:hypothetical protein